MTVDRARPGRRFGPYELLEAIGHGGSAVVYRARDLRPDAAVRDVAVKLIANAFAAAPEFRARFRQEAALVRRLRHRHVLTVYDSGESGPDGPGVAAASPGGDGLATGYAYLVTEYCAGGALDVAMRRTRSTRERCRLALDVATQIGSALDAAHLADILHRDVKPSNILVASDGRLVLGDFGLARALQDGPSQHLTLTGHVTGTPAYMAPEQASGEAADSRSDLYALAVVLFEIVTGTVPFRAETAMAVMLAHVHQPPPRATDLAPGVPPAVSDVLARALEKSRDARYPTGLALAGALRQALATAGRGTTPGPLPAASGGRPGTIGSNDETWPGVPIAGAPRALRASTRGRDGRGWLARQPLAVKVAAAVVVALLVTTGVLAAGGVAGDGATGVAGLVAAFVDLPGRFQAALDSWQSGDDAPTVTEALMPSASRPASLRAGLTIRFSRPMDVATVERSLRYEPPMALDFEWDGQLVVVTPRTDLAPGTDYVVTLATTALSRDGRPLARAVEHRFTTRTTAEATASPGVPTAAPDRIVPGVVTASPVPRTPTIRPAPVSTTRPATVSPARPTATAAATRPAGTPAVPATPASTPRDGAPPTAAVTAEASSVVATTPANVVGTVIAGPMTPVPPAAPAFPTVVIAPTTFPGPTVTPVMLAVAPTSSPMPPAAATVIVIAGATTVPSATITGPRALPTLPPTAVAFPTPILGPSPTVAVVWTPTVGFLMAIPTVGPFPSPTIVRLPTRVPPALGTVTTNDAASP